MMRFEVRPLEGNAFYSSRGGQWSIYDNEQDALWGVGVQPYIGTYSECSDMAYRLNRLDRIREADEPKPGSQSRAQSRYHDEDEMEL